MALKNNRVGIFRYTLSYDDGGGMEDYLSGLNTELLEKNEMDIVQVQLKAAGGEKKYEQIAYSKGTLRKLSVSAEKLNNIVVKANRTERFKAALKKIALEVMYMKYFPSVIREKLLSRKYSPYPGEPFEAVEIFEEVFSNYNPDLVVIHSGGGFNSGCLVKMAQERKIPFIFINHFENDRLKSVGYREQTRDAFRVGGVSSKNIPKYLKNKYVNLSDGIDVQYFSKNMSDRSKKEEKVPVIILPCRIAEKKGHMDLLRAGRKLIERGLYFKMIFAGRVDSEGYKIHLEEIAKKYGLEEHLIFAGNLSKDQLREAYCNSDILVLPTYSEGLGRVLLEAQSMEIPVIAYDVGGTSDAIVDKVAGFLVKKGDVRDLVKKMIILMEDAHLRDEMGEKGRLFAMDMFSKESLGKRHMELYLSAIKSRKYFNQIMKTGKRHDGEFQK